MDNETNQEFLAESPFGNYDLNFVVLIRIFRVSSFSLLFKQIPLIL